MYAHYAPQRWHMLTWMVFLPWLWFGVIQNSPNLQDYKPLSKRIEIPTGSSTRSPEHAGYLLMIGWPYPCQQCWITPLGKTQGKIIHWPSLVANLVIVVLVQTSIVYAFQQSGQFTFRTLMLAILAIATIMTAGRLILSASPPSFSLFLGFVYFLPVFSAILTAIFSRRSRLDAGRIGDECTAPQ
ncbi:MAG: hypothetical protein U0795_09290 [Pirellulales bacterium]